MTKSENLLFFKGLNQSFLLFLPIIGQWLSLSSVLSVLMMFFTLALILATYWLELGRSISQHRNLLCYVLRVCRDLCNCFVLKALAVRVSSQIQNEQPLFSYFGVSNGEQLYVHNEILTIQPLFPPVDVSGQIKATWESISFRMRPKKAVRSVSCSLAQWTHIGTMNPFIS